MDELIIILIRALARMFDSPRTSTKAPPPRPGSASPKPGAPPAFSPGPPPLGRVPQQLRGGRRRTAPPPLIPIAAPIMTSVDPVIPRQSDLANARVAAAAHVATGGSAAGSITVRRWLTPSVLQRQFILTEIFQKPLALRDQHDR